MLLHLMSAHKAGKVSGLAIDLAFNTEQHGILCRKGHGILHFRVSDGFWVFIKVASVAFKTSTTAYEKRARDRGF